MMADDFEQARERFSRKYSQMTDVDLLRIAEQPSELSDAAWEALEDELELRQLELPEPRAVPALLIGEKRNLVVLRRFRDIPDALLARGRLESAGIECFLADDNMVRMDWFISNLLGGVKLLVDADHFTEAARILNEPIPHELEVEGVGDYPQPRCPQCGSLDVAYAELNKKVSYMTAWLGLPIPVVRDDWHCHACAYSWRDIFEDGLEK
jgi:Putative prokaryotic signal transducing protein